VTQTRGHAHHIEIVEDTSHVVVSLEDVVLADTKRPVLLREGSLPTRYYVRPDDVRTELLEPTDSTSHCPFKGDASYLSFGDAVDVAWSYAEPIPGAEKIAGLVCFYNEKVDITVDGERLEPPQTRWS
jgi:uncharacterized protein (DUF427 family)